MSNCIAMTRTQLRAAIDHRAERQSSVRTANQAKQRAQAWAREARAALAEIEGSSQEGARRRAEAIKAGNRSIAPDHTHEARSLAQADLDQAIATLDILVRENAEAARILVASEATVRDAVARLITQEAEVLAQELIVHRERAEKRRVLLLGLSYVGKGGPGDFVLLPTTAKLAAALNWSEPQSPGHINPVKASTASWTKYRDALSQCADVTFVPSPPTSDSAKTPTALAS
jgi:hypothetical protein